MAVTKELQKLVDQMPDPDGRGMYTSDIDKEKIEKAVAEIHKGGRAHVEGLIEMLGEPGSAENVKPHYALHCLANHVLIIKDEKGRKALSEALAAGLGSDRPKHVKAYLCQELGWAGRVEAAPALGRVLTDDALSAPAAMALVAIREGAAEQLRAAWSKASTDSRLNIIDALAALADPKSAEIFKKALKDAEQEVRIAARAGLAHLGTPDAVQPVIEAADVKEGWERIQATAQCVKLAEKLAEAGHKGDAKRVYEYLKKTRTSDDEQHIGDVVTRGLQGVA